MPKLTVENLKRIREQTKKVISTQDGACRVKITVHMGTCGRAAGAQAVMDALSKKIDEHNANDIILTWSGCAGLCSREPMITVETRDSAPIKYGDMDAGKTRRVFDEHVVGGHPVEEYGIALGCERTY